jgi:DNA-directed RNA polymerase II subunit RPB2
MDNKNTWNLIHSYFEENPHALVSHHLESYNDFFRNGIMQLFKEKNPLQIFSKYDDVKKDYNFRCNMYFGGKDGSLIYYGKPVIHDKDNPHYMYPNEARLRNMSYSMSIHYDIELEFVYLLAPGETPKHVSEDMLAEMVNEQLGGKIGVGHLEFDERDYSEEYAEHLRDHAPNFKSVNGGNLEAEKVAGNEHHDYAGEGGAGAGTDKVRRGKKDKVPIKMTTAIAALLRETDERSVVSHVKQVYRTKIEKVLLGRFPVMVQSEFCILHGVPREIRYNMGECMNDPGGYFIIDGKEKTVIMQEKFGDNMLYIQKNGEDDLYSYVANIRSVSENVSKPVRTLAVKMVAPNKKYTNNHIVVSIPNVREPVPLFILFRALGIMSDKEIIETILLDRDKYTQLEDLFIPCVHDAGSILTQQSAILYIAHLTKYHTVSYGLEILNDYFLPHVGEGNYLEKAYYLGNIVFQLVCVASGLESPTDRDNYKYKRVEVVGSLLHDLFREYYDVQMKYIHLEFERRLYKNQDLYEENLHKLVFDNYREIFKTRILDDGFRKAFKGNWGAQPHTKRVGVVQDLNRLSFNSMISHLRKTNLPLDSSVKLVGPRVLHNSHWGFIDPIDTPDGGNIGLHKTLAIMTTISRGGSREPLLLWLREHVGLKRLEECTPLILSTMTKVMVNGLWAGVIDDPINHVKKIRLFRRNGLLHVHMSVTFDYNRNTIHIFNDAGRLCRPIYYVSDDFDKHKISFEVSKNIQKRINEGSYSWSELVSGFNKKRESIHYNYSMPQIYELSELYEGVETEKNPAKLDRFIKEKAIIDYIDPSESENTLIALNMDEWNKEERKRERYTHLEIHESFIFGVMCNMIIFPENNPPTRNSFSCGQSKQAVSLYHTNYQVRMDKMAVVLNSGQVPLVKSRYLEYINHEENPYGENAIVAIMCYTGYNVEDAILINEGAIQRGLFRTTYYTTYEAHEENSKQGHVEVDKKFTNIESQDKVYGTKPGYDYSFLDENGLIKENTPVNEKTILIGLTSNSVIDKNAKIDMSVKPKKGQLGVVDKSFITEGEEGERIAKVRVRDIRIPGLGDKMASRSGQKGTVGMIIRECDMPFTADGVRPDLIINPHAIPTRMTIGQLVECITGKACVKYGAFGDCTAFNNKGSKIGVFGELLPKVGFHSSGNEILYNGMTGEQIETEIFIGPTYYMRLKHMVKDKINYRATGPRAALTRQPVGGRANDGGLRIGEMERDVLVSHGITDFCRESMMERGDKYHLAVCNNSGMVAIYNESKNVFLSPMADGPLQFKETADGKGLVLNNMSRFGRSFSIVSVPYSFKLLLQELQALNIQLRIITDANINQLESLSYSNNIGKLTYDAIKSPKELSARIKDLLANQKPIQKTPEERKKGMGKEEYDEDPRVNEIRKYALSPLSPDYPPLSPEDEYNEKLPEIDNLKPTSPAYVPETPPKETPSSAPTTTASSIMSTIGNVFGAPFGQSPSPEMEGGGGPKYHLGEDICYVKSPSLGLHPNHKWRIMKIGNKFYTIETDLAESNMKDSIQVVEPYEIYKYNPIPDNGYNSYPLMDTQHILDPHHNAQPFMDAYSGETPKINISPVIKIVNGPDNSTNSGEQTPVTPSQEKGSVHEQTPNISVHTPHTQPPKLPQNTQGEMKQTAGADNQTGILGGMIDFGKNLFIKKIGM